MKKVISLVLVCVILMGVAVFSTFAEEPPYSKSFENNDELLTFLSAYAEKFPDVDYSDENINAPNDEYWLENKEVVLPVLPEDYATLEECSVLETRYGGGIDCIFSSYTTIESNTKIRFLTYYQMTKHDIVDKIEGLDGRNKPKDIEYSGLRKGFIYSVGEVADENGKPTSICKIAYDDKFVIVYIDKAFERKFYFEFLDEKLEFINSDVILPVYVYGQENLYEERFFELYPEVLYGYMLENYYYKEISYHHDENGDIDWALVYYHDDSCKEPWIYNGMYKDRILEDGRDYPFGFGFGVYDAKEDKFYEIFNEKFDFDKYKGLDETLTAYEPGSAHGDVDRDLVLSILDATLIQRVMAGLDEYKWNDDLNDIPAVWYNNNDPKYMSDYDRDGERTILDATAIQRKLANISQ